MTTSNNLFRPHIVAVGGTLRANSSTERALKIVLKAAEEEGATTAIISGPDLELPLYAPERSARTEAAQRLIEELRRADGVVLGSPGYHGGISGLVKNALDYTEDMRCDVLPYFDGRAVASIATGGGWQGAVNTLAALRGVVHALRGWNTPMGVAINTSTPLFDVDGNCLNSQIVDSLMNLGRELVEFSRMRNSWKSRRAVGEQVKVKAG